MNAALRADPAAMRVNLTVPSTTVRLAPFAFDGDKVLLGVDLADVLPSLMIGPKSQRPVLRGFVDVYPLAIPDGEGLTIPVRLFGEIGFYNLHSALVLVLPSPRWTWRRPNSPPRSRHGRGCASEAAKGTSPSTP